MVDTVHTTQGSYMDFVDRRIVPTCDFAATVLPGMTSELCGWVGEGDGDGDGDGVVNVLALIRPVDVAKRGMVNERHNPEVVRARRIGQLAAMAWPSTCSLTSRLMQI